MENIFLSLNSENTIFAVTLLSVLFVATILLKNKNYSSENLNLTFPFEYNFVKYVIISMLAIIFYILCLKIINIDYDNIYLNMNMMVTFKQLIVISSIISILIGKEILLKERFTTFEYPLLIAFVILGAFVVLGSFNFITFFLGIELMSFPSYILTVYKRSSSKAAEAGLKYFILGAISSSMLLFGISLIYGVLGTIDFVNIIEITSRLDVEQINSGLFSMGIAFIFAGLSFKLSAAPFHMWTPDVYQGAPYHMLPIFALVPKIAIAGAFTLILMVFRNFYMYYLPIIYFLIISSSLMGVLGALRQNNIARFMAFTGVAQVSFMLLSLVGFGHDNNLSALYGFLLVYTINTCAFFILIFCLRRKENSIVYEINNLKGFGKTNSWYAIAISIVMLSFAGLPPFAGFFAKFYVLLNIIKSNIMFINNSGDNQTLQIFINWSTYISIFVLLMSVISVFYYLRIIKVMFISDRENFETENIRVVSGETLSKVLLFILMFIIVTYGIYGHIINNYIRFAVE